MSSSGNALAKYNVNVSGHGRQPMLFAHGFGCDQNMWHFARVTFLSDNRADLSKVTTPSLVLQCSEDVIAPRCVGEYVHRHVPGSAFVQMRATGHCPNLSAPDETVAAIRSFLSS